MMILFSGCARLQVVGPDAARMTAAVVARLDADPLFAAAPGGKLVAFAREGVRVAPLPAGEPRLLSGGTPLAFAWSPDGGKLAVAFAAGKESRIEVFGADGVPGAETTVAGRAGAIFWTASDNVLVFSVELEQYKFGTSCSEVLLRWNLTGTPERTLLHATTLRPYTVSKWGTELLIRSIHAAVSPQGDELAYGRIMDPPAFEPYLKIAVRNLSTGTEREIAKAGFTDGTARFSADGEGVIVDIGSGQISWLDVWDGAEKPVAPYSGRFLAVSPDGRYLFADGRLLEGGRVAAQFPPRSRGEFLDDGTMLIAAEGTLFLVSGLEPPDAGSSVMPPEKRERLRSIRAWRASGLISADDYVTAREKVMK